MVHGSAALGGLSLGRQVERIVLRALPTGVRSSTLRSGAAWGVGASSSSAVGRSARGHRARGGSSCPGGGLQVALAAAGGQREGEQRTHGNAAASCCSIPERLARLGHAACLPARARCRHGWRARRPTPRPTAPRTRPRRSARRSPAGRPAAAGRARRRAASASLTAAPVMWCASRNGMPACAHQPVGEIGGGGIAQLGRGAHPRRCETWRPRSSRSSPRATGRAARRLEHRRLVVLHVLRIGERQALHRHHQRGQAADDPPAWPRTSSAASGFFFCGMIELPVLSASGRRTKPNGWLAQMISSSASRDRCSAHCAAACR